MIQFLVIMAISKLGDMLAVISIPLFLYEMSGDLTQAASFTVIVTVASMLVSKPASVALRYFNPIYITFFVDCVVCFLLYGLYIYTTKFNFDIFQFLLLCGLIGLVINFPLYIKTNLLHQYFVNQSDVLKFSSLQGNVYSIVFAISILISGVMYDKIGFQGILILDIISYFPLLIILFVYRNKDRKAYKVTVSKVEPDNKETGTDVNAQQLFFYLANGATFFFSTIRSHILLTLLISIYSVLADKTEIAFWALIGALLNLVFSPIIERLRAKFNSYISLVSVSILITLGFIIESKINFGLSVVLISFGFSELIGLCLRQTRSLQTFLQCQGNSEKIAFRAYLFATIISVISLPLFLYFIERMGVLFSFTFFGVLFFVVPYIYLQIRKNVRKSSEYLGVYFIFITISAFIVPTEVQGWEYKTAMSDKVRLDISLTTNSVSEDERFVLNNIHCGLFKYSDSGKFQSDLVKSWEGSKDGLSFSFKIRENIFNSIGEKIDAKYVATAMKDLLIKSIDNHPEYDFAIYHNILGFNKCLKEKKCTLDGIGFNNDILYLKLDRNRPKALDSFVSNLFPIFKISKEGLPVTCGEYKVSKYTNKELLLSRNKYYANAKEGPTEFSIQFLKPTKLYKSFCENKIYDALFLLPGREELEDAGCKKDQYRRLLTETKGYWGINLFSKKLLNNRSTRKRLIESLDTESFRRTWNLEAQTHSSAIPKFFGKYPEFELKPTLYNSTKEKNIPEIIVRYIDGTPNSSRLEQSLNEWSVRSGITFKIIPTPFTDLVKSLFFNDADVYVYAELSTGTLDHFLGWIYTASLSVTSGDLREKINKSWKLFLSDPSRQNAIVLNKLLYESHVFIPLYNFQRPLVFNRKYLISDFPDSGLAGLRITSFQRVKP